MIKVPAQCTYTICILVQFAHNKNIYSVFPNFSICILRSLVYGPCRCEATARSSRSTSTYHRCATCPMGQHKLRDLCRWTTRLAPQVAYKFRLKYLDSFSHSFVTGVGGMMVGHLADLCVWLQTTWLSSSILVGDVQCGCNAGWGRNSTRQGKSGEGAGGDAGLARCLLCCRVSPDFALCGIIDYKWIFH